MDANAQTSCPGGCTVSAAAAFFLFPLTRKKTTFKKLWCSLLPCEHLRGGAAGMGCSHCRAGKAGGSLTLGMSPVAAGRALTPAGHGECHGAPKDAVICCTCGLSVSFQFGASKHRACRKPAFPNCVSQPCPGCTHAGHRHFPGHRVSISLSTFAL